MVKSGDIILKNKKIIKIMQNFDGVLEEELVMDLGDYIEELVDEKVKASLKNISIAYGEPHSIVYLKG